MRLRGADMLVVFVYLVAGEPPSSPDNLAIISQLQLLRRFYKLLALLMGDWNCTPAELESLDWFQKCGLVILKPAGAASACSAGSKRILDFALVSESLPQSGGNRCGDAGPL